jgi:hypothetical protein
VSFIAKIGVALAALIGVIVLFVAAGVTGVLFQLWPTSWPDRTLHVSPEVLTKLRALEEEAKFLPDEQLFYAGAQTNPPREAAENALNAFLEYVRMNLPAQPRRSFLLATMKPLLVAAQTWDSEDQERLGTYLSTVIDITGAGSSNQLLTVWRYGFPYGWLQ